MSTAQQGILPSITLASEMPPGTEYMHSIREQSSCPTPVPSAAGRPGDPGTPQQPACPNTHRRSSSAHHACAPSTIDLHPSWTILRQRNQGRKPYVSRSKPTTKPSREQLQAQLASARTTLAVVIGIFGLIILVWIVMGYWVDNPPAFLITVVIAVALSGILFTRQRSLAARLNRRVEITPEEFNRSLE